MCAQRWLKRQRLLRDLFLAWAIKFVILRIGGAALYRRYRPFFLGALVGYTSGVALSLVVDVIWFPGTGHAIHGY